MLFLDDFDQVLEVIVMEVDLFLEFELVVLFVSWKIVDNFLVFFNEVIGDGILVMVLDRFLSGFFGFIDMGWLGLDIHMILLLVCHRKKMHLSEVLDVADGRLEFFGSIGLSGRSNSGMNIGRICIWARIGMFRVMFLWIYYRFHSDTIVWRWLSCGL